MNLPNINDIRFSCSGQQREFTTDEIDELIYSLNELKKHTPNIKTPEQKRALKNYSWDIVIHTNNLLKSIVNYIHRTS
jgi:hypothetical protein